MHGHRQATNPYCNPADHVLVPVSAHGAGRQKHWQGEEPLGTLAEMWPPTQLFPIPTAVQVLGPKAPEEWRQQLNGLGRLKSSETRGGASAGLSVGHI